MEYCFLLHLEVPRGGTATSTSQHFVGEGVTRKKYLLSCSVNFILRRARGSYPADLETGDDDHDDGNVVASRPPSWPLPLELEDAPVSSCEGRQGHHTNQQRGARHVLGSQSRGGRRGGREEKDATSCRKGITLSGEEERRR
jgi:hypothetical protein